MNPFESKIAQVIFSLRDKGNIFLDPFSFWTLENFISGLDLALYHHNIWGPQLGFREFILNKENRVFSLATSNFIFEKAGENDQKAIELFFNWFSEFYEIKTKKGLNYIYAENKKLYKGEFEHFDLWPDPNITVRNKVPIKEIFNSIKKRPGMYLYPVNFSILKAFLVGFEICFEEILLPNPLINFKTWLDKKFEKNSYKSSWDFIFEIVSKNNEDYAFLKSIELVCEFLNTKEKND